MKESLNKKNSILRFALNTIIFVFFFSFALRAAFLKDLHDLLQKFHTQLESVINEFAADSALGIINRTFLVSSIIFLPCFIFLSNIFFVILFVFLGHSLYNFFNLVMLKTTKALYFNKANSKQSTYISLSRLLC